MRPPPVLDIVVPCYNEEAVLPEVIVRLTALADGLVEQGLAAPGTAVCFVDDGSRDATWQLITRAAAKHPAVRGIKLTRNFGHQAAVLCGLLESGADATVSIDADLQDDESCIADMLRAYRGGADIVYGVRASRASDTWFKRSTARCYYRLLATMGARVVLGHADYRLMSADALQLLASFPERNLFLRGLVPMLGLRSAMVSYDRKERAAGESKYPLRRMLGLAWEGITSLSIVPLRAVSFTGAAVAIGTFVTVLWVLYQRFFTDNAVPGWASVLLPIYFLGGVQILCMGVVGEYIGKIYLETKQRPRYLVAQRVGDETGRAERRGARASEWPRSADLEATPRGGGRR